jgi:hypothetical protein
MESLTFITDETHHRRYAQIDLEEIADAGTEKLEEILDLLIAEAHKNEDKTIDTEQALGH